MKNGLKTHVMALDTSMSTLKSYTFIIAFSILTAIGSWIVLPLPFTPVPITLQTFFVLLSGAFLGHQRGAISQLVYLGYGLIGLPVYSAGQGGAWVLFGPTGGYLLAFPVAAYLTGLMTSRDRNFYVNLGGFFIGSIPILLFGTLQLKILSGSTFQEALTLGFFPFFAGDFLKSCFGAMVLTAKHRFFSKDK